MVPDQASTAGSREPVRYEQVLEIRLEHKSEGGGGMQAGWQPEGASRLLAAELCIGHGN